jgi:TIR domain
MEIFISWSGPRSEAVAIALRAWLPQVINALKPWLSCADIDKGSRWSVDVAGRLESARAGIICLTASNLRSEWVLFETGALSKTIQNTFVCPFLIDLEPSEVKGPLAQFQATTAVKSDVLRMVKTLNASLKESALSDAHIEEAFEVWWPKLEQKLAKLPSDKSPARPARSEKDLLEEILDLVRTQNRYFSLSFTAPEYLFGGRSPRQTKRAYELEHETDFRRANVTGKISGTIYSTEREIETLSVTAGESDVTFLVEPKGAKPYSVVVPFDTPPEKVEDSVKAQISSAKALATRDTKN